MLLVNVVAAAEGKGWEGMGVEEEGGGSVAAL